MRLLSLICCKKETAKLQFDILDKTLLYLEKANKNQRR